MLINKKTPNFFGVMLTFGSDERKGASLTFSRFVSFRDTVVSVSRQASESPEKLVGGKANFIAYVDILL